MTTCPDPKNGVVYQKGYVEFFCSPRKLELLKTALAALSRARRSRRGLSSVVPPLGCSAVRPVGCSADQPDERAAVRRFSSSAELYHRTTERPLRPF